MVLPGLQSLVLYERLRLLLGEDGEGDQAVGLLVSVLLAAVRLATVPLAAVFVTAVVLAAVLVVAVQLTLMLLANVYVATVLQTDELLAIYELTVAVVVAAVLLVVVQVASVLLVAVLVGTVMVQLAAVWPRTTTYQKLWHRVTGQNSAVFITGEPVQDWATRRRTTSWDTTAGGPARQRVAKLPAMMAARIRGRVPAGQVRGTDLRSFGDRYMTTIWITLALILSVTGDRQESETRLETGWLAGRPPSATGRADLVRTVWTAAKSGCPSRGDRGSGRLLGPILILAAICRTVHLFIRGEFKLIFCWVISRDVLHWCIFHQITFPTGT
jgi:hypothetical protein